MGYVTYEIFGKTYDIPKADVLECAEFFGCSYEDALYHMAWSKYRSECDLED